MSHFGSSISHPSFLKTEDILYGNSDLVCLSHLRWDFVYQRPQHLLSRCAQKRRVFFVEEPVIEFTDSWWIEVTEADPGVWVVKPHLLDWVSEELRTAMHQSLMDELFEQFAIANPILWYYTPSALTFTRHLSSSAIVYDCMDELSAFKGASATLRHLEQELFQRADVVFTGGQSLYEAKQHLHANIHAFPSSIDIAHFAQARTFVEDPADQRSIPHPRLGFYGVIDERMNLELLDGIAQARPDWHFVMIGPVVKIDPEQLPQHPNIHYLGSKSYQELPHYLAGWDVAILPFALNESTRFISPTKTPEYLAAGKPVISTSIRDVIRPYGQQGLVQIADSIEDFVAAAEQAMQAAHQQTDWLTQVDQLLAKNSWDQTWENMVWQVEAAIAKRSTAHKPGRTSHTSWKSRKTKAAQSTRPLAKQTDQPLKG